MKELFSYDKSLHTRWSSPENWTGAVAAGGQAGSGRKGSPFFTLRAGESKVLAEVTGQSGTLRRIWMTLRNRSSIFLRGLRLEIFWDGTATPAVSVPVGDFFGHVGGRMVLFENALFSSAEGRSFCCLVPMPFRSGMKVVLHNDTDRHQSMVFYDVNYRLGDVHDETSMYFHASFHHENPTTLGRDFEHC